VYPRDISLFFLLQSFQCPGYDELGGWISERNRPEGDLHENRDGRETGDLSTSAAQAERSPSWKEEVNRRLAAHNSRKGSLAVEQRTHAESLPGASSRAAQAAARVAARYANAPSYSEMLASEARAAVRAAEAVSRAALDAQAAAESLLAGLEAATAVQRLPEPEDLRGGALEPALQQTWEPSVEPVLPQAAFSSQSELKSFGILWDADLPVRGVEPPVVRATHGPSFVEVPADNWWEPALAAQNALGAEAIEVVEPAQPIHANLIEFPRELVATRKIRPRLADGPHGELGNSVGQLSIFEVDPGSISIEPAAAEPVAETAAPAWPGPDWSSIQLGEQSLSEQTQEMMAAQAEEEEAASANAALQLAPMSLRLMAAAVDSALIVGAFSALAMTAMNKVKALPPIKEVELGSAVALAVLAVLYMAFFFTVAAATPGMKWARISLCTFGGEKPARGQRYARLWALALSLLPVGLGVVWSIFDEDHLSWHDRLSGTCLRKS